MNIDEPGQGTGMKDALAFIVSDHRQITDRLGELATAINGHFRTRRGQFARAAMLIAAHEHMEEEILYPAIGSDPEGIMLVRRSIEQHRAADALVQRLHSIEGSEDEWAAVVRELEKGVREHVEYEQQNVLPLARRIFDQAKLAELAKTMKKRRQERLDLERRQARTSNVARARAQNAPQRLRQGRPAGRAQPSQGPKHT